MNVSCVTFFGNMQRNHVFDYSKVKTSVRRSSVTQSIYDFLASNFASESALSNHRLIDYWSGGILIYWFPFDNGLKKRNIRASKSSLDVSYISQLVFPLLYLA